MATTKDLTSGSVAGHILAMAAPITAYMIVGALNSMVDLYFVAQLGSPAVAGVSVGSSVFVLVFALGQVVGIGTATLVSQALGRKAHTDANLIFNQAMALSVALSLCVLVACYFLAPWYVQTLAVDMPTANAGMRYLYGLIPGLMLQFALPVVASALRAIGSVGAPTVIYVIGIAVHMLLAPVLITGWGTGVPLYTAGAGLANSAAIVTVVALLWMYFHRRNRHFRIKRHQLRPIWTRWKLILIIGLPAGGEAILMFLHPVVILWTIRNFGTDVQAGFGAGWRLLQVVLIPAMALALAVAPIVGQNFGADAISRIRETFRKAAMLICIVMLAITVFLQWHADSFLRLFTDEPGVVAAGGTFLRLTSIALVARGLVSISSSLFQGIGNTVPPLLTSVLSFLAFLVPATLWLKAPGFRVEYIWYLWAAATTTNALINIFLLRRELNCRLCKRRNSLSALTASAEQPR